MSELKSYLQAALQGYIGKTDLSVSETQQNTLVDYVMLMDKWNKAYNLTSVRDPHQMLVKHIVDSIVIAPYLNGKRYIDVGTGPGLPGIPLAIMLPEVSFVLLDSLGKRVRFMKQVAFELKITNIEPVQSRVEQYRSELGFDGVISRAFASLKDMLHWCQHLVDSQGEFLALKGQFPQQELDQLPAGFALQESFSLNVPGLEGERHLLKIRKTA